MNDCNCAIREKLYLKCGHSNELFVCATCMKNVEINTLQLPSEIVQQLQLWQSDYGNWLDDQSGIVFHGGDLLIQIHHDRGTRYSQILKETYNQNVEYQMT